MVKRGNWRLPIGNWEMTRMLMNTAQINIYVYLVKTNKQEI